MKNKRIISFIIALIAAISCVGMSAYAVDEVAEVYFGQSMVNNGFDSVSFGNSTLPLTGTLGETSCWLLNPNSKDHAYINFSLCNDLKNDIMTSEYVFEVDYFDEANKFLVLEYDSQKISNDVAKVIYTKGTNTWKTARFSVNNAYFYKRLSGYDFRLTVIADGVNEAKSNGIVAVKRVKIIKHSGVNPVQLSASTDESGNAFEWYKDTKIIHNDFNNSTAQKQTVNLRYRLINDNGVVCFEKNESKLLRIGKTRVDIDIGELETCDIYKYEVKIFSDDGNINSTYLPMDIAVLKTDPDGVLNEDVSFASHLEWYSDTNIQNQGIDMIRKSNSYGIRSNFDWDSMERVKGTLDFDDSNMNNIVKKLYENNLHLIPILSGPSLFYCSAWNEMPKTEDQLNGWRRYAAYSANILKNYNVKEYEIWNEPNLEGFNLHNDDGGVYAQLFKIAAEEIKGVDTTAKVGGAAVTGINGYWGRNYFTKAMECGMGDYLDAITLHTYTDDAVDKTGMDSNVVWFKNEFARFNSSKNPEIWQTETGYSSANDGIDERVKGALNCRAAILYKSKGLSDKTVFYNFEKKGFIENDEEHQFGHVSMASLRGDKSGKCFVPTKAFAMITGMNYVMANSEADEIIESEDKNIKICTFDSRKFNSKVLAIYAVNNSKCITLNLGTNKVEVYDSMGNFEEMYGINGQFIISATDEPVYIVGNISDVSIADENFVSVDNTVITAAESEFLSIRINKNTDTDLQITAELPQNIILARNSGFINNKAELTIKNNAKIGANEIVRIRVCDQDKTVAVFDVKIKTVFESEGNDDLLLINVFSASGMVLEPSDRAEFDVRYGNSSDYPIDFTAKYDLYRENEFVRSDVMQYSILPYSVCGDTLIIPDERSGEYKLRISVFSGDREVSSKEVQFTRKAGDINRVYSIKGNVPSGKEGTQVSLVVYGGNESLSEDTLYSFIYNDQQTTGISGSFNFKIRVPYNSIRAYVISESGDTLDFYFNSEGETEIVPYIAKGMIKADRFSAEEISSLLPEYLVELRNTKELISYDAYCILYKNGRLVSVVKVSDDVASTDMKYKNYGEISRESDIDFDKLKVLLWSKDMQKPICIPYER